VKRLIQLAGLAVGLLIMLIAGVFLWLKFLDPQQASEALRAALEHATGRSVTISGPLQVTLRPLPSITVSQVTIANPDWAKSPKMVSIQRLTVRPSLRRLLLGKVLLHRINIEGVQLWLENGPDGQPSWLLSRGGSSPVGVPEIRVDSLRASKLRASYFDAKDGITRSLSLQQLDASAGNSDQPIKISVQGEVMQLPLAISGQIGSPDQVQGGRPFSFSLQGSLGQTRLTTEGKLLNLDFRDLSGVEAKFNATGKQPRVLMAWTDLAIPKMDHFEISGQMTGSGDLLKLYDLDAQLGDPTYKMHITGGIADLINLSGMALEFESSGVSPVSFLPRIKGAWLATDQYDASGKLVGSVQKVDLTDLIIHGTVKQTQLELTGTFGDLAGAGDIDVVLTIDGRNMASVSSFFELPVPDVDELKGSARATGTWDHLDVSDINARIREGSISGTLKGTIGSLPDLQGLALKLQADGSDIRDLQPLLGLDSLPQTDKASATLGLSGRNKDVSLQIHQLDLERGPTRLSGTGWLQDLGDVPRIDVKFDASGTNLQALAGPGLGKTSDLKLPVTDRFRVQGRLRGHLATPDLDGLVAEAEHGAMKISLSGELPNVTDPESFKLSGSIAGDDLATLGQTFGQHWPTSTSFELKASGQGNWAHPRIHDLSGTLKTTDMDLQLAGSIGDLRALREVNLDVEASAPSLLGLLPGEVQGWERMGAAKTRFNLSGGPVDFDLDLEQLDAGETQIRGLLAVVIKDLKLLSVRGDLKGSKLDLLPWMDDSAAAPGTRKKTKTRDKPHGRNDAKLVFPDQPLPVAWMDGLKIDLELTDLALGLGKTQLQVLQGQLEVGQGVLAIDPFRIGYVNDEITGLVRLDTSIQPNLLKAQLKSLDFDLGTLIQRMGYSKDARGTVDLMLQIESSGDSPRAMAASTNGRFSLLLQDGFSSEKLVSSLSVSEALLSLLPWSRPKEGTTVDCAMVDLPITAGIASSHILVLDTSDMQMRGSGEIDLRQERYDLLLKPRPKRGKAMGFNANVRVTGPLDDPHFGLAAGATAIKAAGTVGRFALLGPLGLFVSADNFRSTRTECAQSLQHISQLK